MSFLRDFSEFPELWPKHLFDLWNYGPKIHQNLRNYGYQFFGQNGTSPSHNRLSYPPEHLPHFNWVKKVISFASIIAVAMRLALYHN